MTFREPNDDMRTPGLPRLDLVVGIVVAVVAILGVGVTQGLAIFAGQVQAPAVQLQIDGAGQAASPQDAPLVIAHPHTPLAPSTSAPTLAMRPEILYDASADAENSLEIEHDTALGSEDLRALLDRGALRRALRDNATLSVPVFEFGPYPEGADPYRRWTAEFFKGLIEAEAEADAHTQR